ncbi:OB-fold domain-containing protein [Cytobacillus sp. FSL R5-0569]|uniref:Zn-ribbon domain-containing OB-fold protein n=1 Tax=Cytobacillus TaxID=2675230 RepID=UPI00278AA2B8|nr:OB-fold domain-containing protein [Cytobacillus kochii]MDQ0185883.1 putative OB-fold protein [Cytobacillus kochii]
MEVTETVQRPLPTRANDRDWNLFAPFWEATRNGELIVQECSVTKKKVWPPRFVSPYSPGADLLWVPVNRKGTVYTYNISNRGFLSYFEDKTPYSLVVVELEEGVRMLGKAVGVDPTEIHCGMEMEVAFEKINDEMTLVNWTPSERS